MTPRSPDTKAPDPQGVIGQIARIRERANLLLEKELAERGVSGVLPAHGAVLAFLFRQTEPVPIKEIVAGVGRVKSTVTGMIQTLERHGYLEREVSPADSRVSLIRLSGRGRALRPAFDAISGRLQETVYGSMAASDRIRLVRLLAQVEHNLVPKR